MSQLSAYRVNALVARAYAGGHSLPVRLLASRLALTLTAPYGWRLGSPDSPRVRALRWPGASAAN